MKQGSEKERMKHGRDSEVRPSRLTALATAIVMAGAGATVAIGAEDEQTTASSQAPRTLEEVVVTAQKRGAQSLLEVPISISVLSGDSLDGATFQGVAEALTTVPGMTLYTEGQNGGSKLSVRGVTAGGSLFAGSGTVAYYVDEVPFGLVKTAVVPDANAYDLERVEALRGPMGTLYGASALNGVVRIMSKQADLEDFEFKARTSISNTKDGGDNYRADMAVNIPIIEDKLAARAVIGYSDLSGWIDNSINSDTNDGELSNLRLNIKAQPTDRLSVELTNWFSRNEFGAPSVAPVPLRSPSTIDEPLSNDYNLHGLTVRYEFDGFTVTSATSYMEYESRGLQDIAAGFATLFTGLFSEVFSQEIRLHSTGEGDWQWSGGAFYREAKDDLLQTLPELLPAPIAWTDESESVAIFGELTRLFKGGDIEVTAGLRYFEDDVGVFETVRNTGVASEPLIAATSSYDTITPRLLLSWAPRDDMKVYASYSRGFRSGFDQNPLVLTVAPDFTAVEEDTLDNYELGFKGSLFEDHLLVDASVYYMDWSDVQQTVGVPLGPDVTVITPINAGDASGPGIDLGLTYNSPVNLQVGVTLSWNDLTLDSEVLSEGVVLFDEGDRLSDSSEVTAGVFVKYLLNLPATGLSAELAYTSNYHSEMVSRSVSGGSASLTEANTILNARASAKLFGQDDWVATLYVDNLYNEQGTVQAFPGEDVLQSRLRPRTIGLQFEYFYQ